MVLGLGVSGVRLDVYPSNRGGGGSAVEKIDRYPNQWGSMNVMYPEQDQQLGFSTCNPHGRHYFTVQTPEEACNHSYPTKAWASVSGMGDGLNNRSIGLWIAGVPC